MNCEHKGCRRPATHRIYAHSASPGTMHAIAVTCGPHKPKPKQVKRLKLRIIKIAITKESRS
jgi:hypothetical protein